MNKTSIETEFSANQEHFLKEWSELLRFKSISTDPSYVQECQCCANWLVDHLEQIGMESALWLTPSKATVFAEFTAPVSKDKVPTVLFYGHYDVQPVDPVELWTSDPFDPQVRDGRLYARGAQDNKGQAFYFIKAVESAIKAGTLRCNLKIVLEGEEECGSEGFSAKLDEWSSKLQADVLMVCDTGTVKAGIGAITMGLRGIAHLTVALKGPNKDLHSGVHGGVVRNPAAEISRLLDSLYNPDGSIAVAGYYDGCTAIDASDRALANAFPLSMTEYAAMVGTLPEGGEQAFTPWERRGFRPTIEINGVHSGYGGPGGKTIIPATAFAKISTRLVAGQDPQHCLSLIRKHLESNTPRGVELEITEESVGGPALRLSSKTDIVRCAAKVLKEVCEVDPVYMWEGASIPVVSSLAQVSGAAPLLVGFGLEEDNIHAPNESFAIDQFKQGYLYVSLMLSELSR